MANMYLPGTMCGLFTDTNTRVPWGSVPFLRVSVFIRVTIGVNTVIHRVFYEPEPTSNSCRTSRAKRARRTLTDLFAVLSRETSETQNRQPPGILLNTFFFFLRNQAEMAHTCRGTINLANAFIHTEDSCSFVISNGGNSGQRNILYKLFREKKK